MEPIIWQGSGSNPSGNTPYGFYDNDPQFVSDAIASAKWAAMRLGYPVQDIELSDLQFYAAYEESISEYGATVNNWNIRQNLIEMVGSEKATNISGVNIRNSMGKLIQLAENYGSVVGAGGNITWYSGSIDLTAGQQTYDLNSWAEQNVSGSSIRIKQIYHYPTPASRRFYGMTGYDYYGGINEEFGFNTVAGGTQYIMRPLYEDLLRMTRIELTDQIRRSSYSFELINNQIKIFPVPTTAMKLWFRYTVKEEEDSSLYGAQEDVVSDHHNIPYQNLTYSNINSVGKHWIKRYFLASCKEMLGLVRSKFPNIPIPNGEVSLDGDSLRSMAETEKQALKEELNQILEESTKTKQLENKMNEAEALQNIMKKFPLKIFVG